MEPYRPFVDKLVVELVQEEMESGNNPDKIELNKNVKSALLNIPVLDVKINGQRSPLMVAAGITTASLAKCYLGEIRKISYPEFL